MSALRVLLDVIRERREDLDFFASGTPSINTEAGCSSAFQSSSALRALLEVLREWTDDYFFSKKMTTPKQKNSWTPNEKRKDDEAK